MPEVLVQIPSGIPLGLVGALGELLGTVLPDTQLAAGGEYGVAAKVQLPDEMTVREATDRIRHAVATLDGVEYAPAPPAEEDGEDLTLNRLEIQDGRLTVGMGGAREVAERAAKNILAAFVPLMDELGGASNYLEWEADVPSTREGAQPWERERVALILVRPGGKTPHKLRQEAEAEVERLRGELAASRG